MADMLVKLNNLPKLAPLIEIQRDKGIEIRRAIVPEKHIIVEWVRKNFNDRWADECDVSFSKHPVSCFVAIKDLKIIGFACYNTTYKNFFGPIGVHNDFKKMNIGETLLIACLCEMSEEGYTYAIIGAGTGVLKFYSKTVNAAVIEGSESSIYKNMIWGQQTI